MTGDSSLRSRISPESKRRPYRGRGFRGRGGRNSRNFVHSTYAKRRRLSVEDDEGRDAGPTGVGGSEASLLERIVGSADADVSSSTANDHRPRQRSRSLKDRMDGMDDGEGPNGHLLPQNGQLVTPDAEHLADFSPSRPPRTNTRWGPKGKDPENAPVNGDEGAFQSRAAKIPNGTNGLSNGSIRHGQPNKLSNSALEIIDNRPVHFTNPEHHSSHTTNSCTQPSSDIAPIESNANPSRTVPVVSISGLQMSSENCSKALAPIVLEYAKRRTGSDGDRKPGSSLQERMGGILTPAFCDTFSDRMRAVQSQLQSKISGGVHDPPDQWSKESLLSRIYDEPQPLDSDSATVDGSLQKDPPSAPKAMMHSEWVRMMEELLRPSGTPSDDMHEESLPNHEVPHRPPVEIPYVPKDLRQDLRAAPMHSTSAFVASRKDSISTIVDHAPVDRPNGEISHRRNMSSASSKIAPDATPQQGGVFDDRNLDVDKNHRAARHPPSFTRPRSLSPSKSRLSDAGREHSPLPRDRNHSLFRPRSRSPRPSGYGTRRRSPIDRKTPSPRGTSRRSLSPIAARKRKRSPTPPPYRGRRPLSQGSPHKPSRLGSRSPPPRCLSPNSRQLADAPNVRYSYYPPRRGRPSFQVDHGYESRHRAAGHSSLSPPPRSAPADEYNRDRERFGPRRPFKMRNRSRSPLPPLPSHHSSGARFSTWQSSRSRSHSNTSSAARAPLPPQSAPAEVGEWVERDEAWKRHQSEPEPGLCTPPESVGEQKVDIVSRNTVKSEDAATETTVSKLPDPDPMSIVVEEATGTDPPSLPLPCHNVPGIWASQEASSHADILAFSFEVDEKTAVTWNLSRHSKPQTVGKTNTKRIKPRIALHLQCLPADILKETLESMMEDQAEGLARVALSVTTKWPPKGQLIVEVNPQDDCGQRWFPTDMVDNLPLDVTYAIQQGTNLIQCIQLAPLECMFILHASPIAESSQNRDDEDVKLVRHLDSKLCEFLEPPTSSFLFKSTRVEITG